MWKWWRSSEGYCTLCAFAAMAAFLYMAFTIELRASVPPCQYKQNRPVSASQADTNSDANPNKPLESLWQRTTNEPVALFTFWLVVATAILATVAVVQAGLFVWQLGLMEGIGDAKIAAEAAEISAKGSLETVRVLRNAQRPYLSPLIPNCKTSTRLSCTMTGTK
jgi:hypothetical protein